MRAMPGPLTFLVLAVALSRSVGADSKTSLKKPRPECGPPARLAPATLERLYFFAYVSTGDPALVAQFLSFYATRGVAFGERGRARLVIHDASHRFGGAAFMRVLLDHNVSSANVRAASLYSSARKVAAVNAFLLEVPSDGLLMYPDVDEFFDAPAEAFDSAAEGDGFVRGRFFDRVAADWSLALCGIPTDSKYLELECSGTNFWGLLSPVVENSVSEDGRSKNRGKRVRFDGGREF